MLDVGADELAFGEGDGCGTLNFFEELYPWPGRITALGLQDGVRLPRALPAHRATSRATPARCRSRTATFDIVFSNAVIEHVGGRERQRRLVSEALRVGRRVFLTTPNRRFPIEVHTRLPLVHWLPDAVLRTARTTRWGRGSRRRSDSCSSGAFESLFPGRVRIVNLGLTLVAIVD